MSVSMTGHMEGGFVIKHNFWSLNIFSSSSPKVCHKKIYSKILCFGLLLIAGTGIRNFQV